MSTAALPAPTETLIVATRGSRLALKQAAIVSELVREANPGLAVEIRPVTTSGDTDSRPFTEIGGRGVFIAEVEREVLEERAHVAVHSAKDMTNDLAPGCAVISVPRRASAADVVVGASGASGEERLGGLPSGARVGTSSMRRRALVAEARQDLDVVEFRGNLDTRLEKVARGDVDCAIVAAAGLERLAPDTSAAQLDPTWWVPAPAQGALAVEALAGRGDIAALFADVGDSAAAAEVACERAFSRRLEGGCSVPLGCLAEAREGGLVVTGYLGAPDGTHGIRDRISGSTEEAAALGAELAEAILACGGDDILQDLAEFEITEPSPP